MLPGRPNGTDMLKLLLDEHISPDVADGLRRRNPSLVTHCMTEWEGGGFLGKDDSASLLQAAQQGLTLVTYDRRTIPPLLKTWAEEGRQHAGVIFVDEKTISLRTSAVMFGRCSSSPKKPGNGIGAIECVS